jgi:hypothetical protein
VTSLSPEQDAAIGQLETVARKIEKHERESEKRAAALRRERADAIARCLAAKVPKSKTAAAAGIHRSRLYVLLDER